MRITVSSKKYRCVNNCNNGSLIMPDKPVITIQYYKEGKVYTYYMTSDRDYNVIYCEDMYCGYVTNDFIEKNFILESEYNSTLNEVDKLFENYLII